MPTTYTYQRGETVSVMIEAVGAGASDLSVITGVSAVLKPALAGVAVPPESTLAVATFEVTAYPGDPTQGIGAGYILTLSAAVTAALPVGRYITNAVLQLAGGAVSKSDPLVIELKDATS